MKNNSYTYTKATQHSFKKITQPTAIKSLRSIINETKVPLSDYINKQRCSIQKKGDQIQRQRTKTSYFEKFKGMIGNNVLDRRQELTFMTPLKILEQIQNMEEEEILQENKTIDHGVRPNIYRKTFHQDFANRSRSKSINQNNNNKQSRLKPNERLSFQLHKISKTQKQQVVYNPLTIGLPPKPLRINLQQRTTEIRKNPYPQNDCMPTGRSRVIRQKDNSLKEQRQNPAIKSQNSLNQMIQNIHSHRRLNFYRQEERRKEVIIYGKSFQKIRQNIHCNQIQFIESTPIQIGQVLGNGAFSYVKIGNLKGRGTNQQFAIKIYEKYKLIQPGRKNRVMKEIQILSHLDHPNVIKLFCAYQNKRQIHILFEQIEESITLQQYFKHMSLKFNDPQLLIFIMRQVLKGLQYLHSLGVSHRDIKPDNILLSFKNNSPVVKLIDFGFATNSSVSNIYCGTPNFMAPELFKKQQYSPLKSDVWAFAVMFYYLWESKYPFKGFNEKNLTRNICENKVKYQKTPIQFEEILSLLFQTNPDTRISLKNVSHLMNRL